MSYSEWETYKLGDLVESISVRHAFNKTKLIFLNTSDILNGKVLNKSYADINTFPGQAKKSIKKGDILFSEIRPKNKRFALVNFDADDYVVSTKLMVLRRKSELIDNKFLYFYLTSDQTINYLQSIAEGRSGTFPQITFNELRDIKIKLPDINEQKAIANILSTLDEKIETNNQINEKLEEMAQTIFKQWFVDFEFPNENGEPYKSSGGEMVESELGLIPIDWKIGDIYNIIDVKYGAAYKSKQFNENGEGLPLIRIRDLKNANPLFYTTEKHPNETIVNIGDILLGMDAEFTPTIWKGKKAYLNQRVCQLKPNKDYVHKYYVYELIKPFMKFYEHSKVGTTVIHLGKADIDKIRICIPTKEVLKEFSILINPIFQKILEVSNENLLLKEIRDTLLPKLMSGEIRVPVEE